MGRYAQNFTTCCCVMLSMICGALVVWFLLNAKINGGDDGNPWLEFEKKLAKNDTANETAPQDTATTTNTTGAGRLLAAMKVSSATGPAAAVVSTIFSASLSTVAAVHL